MFPLLKLNMAKKKKYAIIINNIAILPWNVKLLVLSNINIFAIKQH
jgi:hypothetical protein